MRYPAALFWRCTLACGLFCILPAASAVAHEDDEPAPAAVAKGGLRAPALVERVEPVYPEAARAQGLGGAVGLELDVGVDGHVTAVRVVRAAGSGFDEAAVAAALKFTFRPATRDGKPIAATVLFDQSFVVRPHLSAETSAEAPAAVVTPAAPPAPPPNLAAPAGSYESMVIGRGPTTAASSTTIRNLDFDLRPRTSPNDVLRVVPGLLAVQHQGGGKADQLFLRGFDADHGTDVGVFFDGIPVNMGSHAHGQGFADLHWLIPETLERIDVMKGPYDVRYGDFATAGAVNLITKDRLESSSLQYTLGMLPTISGRTVSSGRFVGIIAPELHGWASKIHPWIAFEAAYDNGPFIASEDLKRYNLFSKVTVDVSPRFKIGVFFQAYGSGWIGSGQIPSRDVANIGRFGSEDPTEGGQTQRQMFSAFARYRGGDQELEATVYVTRYKLALFNDFTFFLNDPVHGDEIEQDDARVFSGAKISYHFHRRWHGIGFRSTAGAEMRYDGIHVDRWNVESQDGDFRKRLGRLNVTSLGAPGADDDIDILNIAGYAEEDVVFTRWLRIIGAVRADFFGFNVDDQDEVLGAGAAPTTGTRQFSNISPKATIVLTPLRELLEIYLNFGEGFHTNMAQVALNDGKTITNAAGETFKLHAIPKYYGGEIGVRSHLFERLDLAAALWASYLENETTFDADDGSFEPSAPTRRIGVDFEARAKLLSWLWADFDLAQASSTAVANGGNGGAVALAPKLYMTGGFTARHPIGGGGAAGGGVRGGLRFRYLGARPAFDESSPEYQYFTAKTLANGARNPDYDPSRVIAQGYFIVDAYGAYRWRWVEVGFSIQNLFNSLWREAQFGNRSCTYDETYNPHNPNYSGSGNQLSDGSFANRCGIGYAVTPGSGANTRSGVTDVHYTPGIPFNLQLTAKVYF